MVVVFGSINLDLVARVPRIPAPGETIAATALDVLPGGKGANQALAARTAGAAVALFGAVGTDAFAADALVHLRAAGVDLAGVAAVAGATGLAMIDVDGAGENAITVVPGANAHAQAAQVPDRALDRDTTLLLQLEVPVVEVAALAARAHARGAFVLLNAAPALPLPFSLLRAVDLLLVNETEAAAYAAAWNVPADPAAFVRAMRERHAVRVVLTLGAQGALMEACGRVRPFAPPMVRVVDATGAGDAFAGALAAAFACSTPADVALDKALAAGARACTHRGAQRWPPLRD